MGLNIGAGIGNFTYPNVAPMDVNAMGQWGGGNPMVAANAPPPVAPAMTTGVGVASTMGQTPIQGVLGNILNDAGLGQAQTPAGAPNGSGFFGADSGFGFNLGTAQTIASGLQSFGSLYNTFQQTKMAGQQLDFQKEAYTENLANTKKNYNTTLEDRIKSRYQYYGKSSKEADEYLAKHKM